MKGETVEQAFTRWLADGETWIGIFEDADLDSVALARRIAFPYAMDQFAVAVVDVTRAPDTASNGPGWRYVLVAKCRTVKEALAAYGGAATDVATEKPTRPKARPAPGPAATTTRSGSKPSGKRRYLLGEGVPGYEQILGLFRALTGREPTPEDKAEVRSILSKHESDTFQKG